MFEEGSHPTLRIEPADGVARRPPPPESNGTVDHPPATGAAVEPVTADQLASLEAEVADWQRRAVMWRERALSTQALNEALASHLEDLQAVLQLRAASGDEKPAAAVAREPVEQWWTRVFRRDTWTGSR